MAVDSCCHRHRSIDLGVLIKEPQLVLVCHLRDVASYFSGATPASFKYFVVLLFEGASHLRLRLPYAHE